VITTEFRAVKALLWLVAIAATLSVAQGQQPGSAAAKVPNPTIFPAPGTYSNTTSLVSPWKRTA